jgi:hypothetical protein
MRRLADRCKASRPVRAGALHGDLDAAAQKIYLALVDGDVVAWADAEADIWFVRVDGTNPVVNDSTVGIYRMGASPADILDDLVELRRSRSTDAIIY